MDNKTINTINQILNFIYCGDKLMSSSLMNKPEQEYDPMLLQMPFSLMIAGENEGYMPSHGTSFSQLPFAFALDKITEEDSETIISYKNSKYNLLVECHFETFNGVGAIGQYNVIKNNGEQDIIITHFSSALVNCAAYNWQFGASDENDLKIHYFRQTWEGESQHREATPEELGLYRSSEHSIPNCAEFSSTGSWSTKKLLPLFFIEDVKNNRTWYIQHEASANWQIQIGAKSFENHEKAVLFFETNSLSERNGCQVKSLKPGEQYSTFKTAYGYTDGGLQNSVAELTDYRRKGNKKGIRSLNPIVFNDYMNCLWAQPSDKKLIPLIDKAAEIGAEAFCIDAGWYGGTQNWGEFLGDWNINNERFGEKGLKGVLDYIISKGMKAGIWFEIECAVPNANIYNKPDNWFLMRNGKRIISNGRSFFDFTNKEVIEYLNNSIENLIGLGISYIKNDYNECVSVGAENIGSSLGDGLDTHIKAVYKFFEELKKKHPSLIIENCGSGAMRQDYGILSILDLQSTSDQENYKKYPSIINGSLVSLLPEHAGFWAYPNPISLKNLDNPDILDSEDYKKSMSDGEETVFNMISGMSGLPYISGRIDKANDYNIGLIKEAVDLYKLNRSFVASSYPVFPLGFARFNDDKRFVATGLKYEKRILLSVWRLDTGSDTVKIPFGKDEILSSVKQIYPSESEKQSIYEICNQTNELVINMPKTYTARYFEVLVK